MPTLRHGSSTERDHTRAAIRYLEELLSWRPPDLPVSADPGPELRLTFTADSANMLPLQEGVPGADRHDTPRVKGGTREPSQTTRGWC